MTDDHTHEADGPPSMPRWVTVFIIVGILLVLLVGFALLSGGHGPGIHS